MNLSQLLGFTEEKNVPQTKGGQGKKKCRNKNCSEYIGVRSKICKYCKYDFTIDRQQELPLLKLPEPVYVFEHLRTDTWEAEQANKILSRKETLAEKQNEFIYVPSEWRPLCYSVEECLDRLNRTGQTLKEDLNRIIVKCIKTNNFRFDKNNKRVGKLQELVVVEVIDI